MTNSILTASTQVQLLRAKMPADKAWFDVPDARLSPEQQNIIKTAQRKLYINESSTFCIGNKKDTGERVITEPKLVKGTKDSVAIRWGKTSYPLPAGTTLDDVTVKDNRVVVTVKGYQMALSFCDVSKMDEAALNKQQKMLRGASDALKRMELVKKLPLAELGFILHSPGASFTKLADMEKGSYVVTSYAATTGMYGIQYKLNLDDGRKVDGNTATKRICEEWDNMGVEVSESSPATLIVGATSLTKSGKTMVAVELYSHQDMDLEPFDFTSDGGSSSEVEIPVYEDEAVAEDLDFTDKIPF